MTKKELINKLTRVSIPIISIKSFLKLINIPNKAIELREIQPALPFLSQMIDKIAHYYPQVKVDPNWQAIAIAIQSIDIPDIESGDSKRPPLWGEYIDHSIYVALWAMPTHDNARAVYLALLVHVIFARKIIHPKTKKHPEYKNVLTTAPASVRRVGQSPYLELLPTIKTKCNAADLFDNIHQSDLADELAPVCTLLGYVTGKSAPRRNGIKRFTTLDTQPYLYKMPCDFDDQSPDAPQTTIIEQVSRHDAEDRQLAHCEISHATPLIQLSESDRSNAIQTISQSVMRAKRAARTALQIRNQCLPHNWANLTDFEIYRLWAAIEEIFKQESLQKKQTAALLALMLCCGQKLEQVYDFSMYATLPLPQNPASGLQLYNGIWFWISIPCTPKISEPTPLQQVIMTENHIVIALPNSIQNILRQFDLSIPGAQIFSFDVETARANVQKVLSNINHREHTRLTADRISHYLFAALQQQTGADVTTSMLVTGQSEYVGTVISHYTAQRINQLISRYHTAWLTVFPLWHFPSATKINQGIAIVGSTRVPAIDAVKLLIKQTLEISLEKKEIAANSDNIIDQIRWHNALTRYVAIMVAYSIGVRAVASPMPHSSDIDLETGFCILSDKDNADGYHTRLIWIPPLCLQQLQNYWRHVRLLSTRISILQADFFTSVKAKRTKKLENQLYFLCADGSPQEITPKVLHDFSDLEQIHLPQNANRHLLRSWLLWRNCPPEIINAYMGHWFDGEEPWGRNSTLNPEHYRQLLAQHLPIFIETLGFKAI